MEELLSLKKRLEEFLASADTYKNCYFWNASRLSAATRRSKEFDRDFYFGFENKTYFVRESLEVSCKNYYYSKTISVDGVEKDLRAIKSVIKKISNLTEEV